MSFSVTYLAVVFLTLACESVSASFQSCGSVNCYFLNLGFNI